MLMESSPAFIIKLDISVFHDIGITLSLLLHYIYSISWHWGHIILLVCNIFLGLMYDITYLLSCLSPSCFITFLICSHFAMFSISPLSFVLSHLIFFNLHILYCSIYLLYSQFTFSHVINLHQWYLISLLISLPVDLLNPILLIDLLI